MQCSRRPLAAARRNMSAAVSEHDGSKESEAVNVGTEEEKGKASYSEAQTPQQTPNDEVDSDEEPAAPSTDDDAPLLLGFLEDKVAPLTREFFPCKAGGRPAWLNPRELPSDLLCKQCQEPLRFLLQIYAPLEQQHEAFHRMLYVFCCSTGTCLNQSGSIRVLRSQLPRKNPFYSFDPPPESEEAADDVKQDDFDDAWNGIHICVVCGHKGVKLCGQCKRAHYCSRAHQKAHWKAEHSTECAKHIPDSSDANTTTAHQDKGCTDALRALRSRWLLPEKEIVIEEEDVETDVKSGAKASREMEEKLLETYKEQMKENKDEDGLYVDADAQHLWKKADPYIQAFQEITAASPDQIIRYIRSPHARPLWVSSKGQCKTEDIPQCPHCRGTRDFEFQVMPQLLYFLKVDKAVKDQAMDWGTLAVYSCRNSCGDGSKQYFEEFVHRQPPAT